MGIVHPESPLPGGRREKGVCLSLGGDSRERAHVVNCLPVRLRQRRNTASHRRHQQMQDKVPVPAALKMTMCNIDLFFFLNAERKLQIIIKSRHLEFSGLHDGL